MVSTVINESSRTALECTLCCNCSAKKTDKFSKKDLVLFCFVGDQTQTSTRPHSQWDFESCNLQIILPFCAIEALDSKRYIKSHYVNVSMLQFSFFLTANSVGNTAVIQPVVVVKIGGFKFRALLDSGASHSYASSTAIELIKVRPKSTGLRQIAMLTGITTRTMQVFAVVISSVAGDFKLDVDIENMLSKASSRMYILRVCKYYGFPLQELTLLFDSLIMSLFTYVIEVWASAHYSKYLSHIDKFCKRALRYGYTSKYTPITDVIRMKDRLLWKE